MNFWGESGAEWCVLGRKRFSLISCFQLDVKDNRSMLTLEIFAGFGFDGVFSQWVRSPFNGAAWFESYMMSHKYYRPTFFECWKANGHEPHPERHRWQSNQSKQREGWDDSVRLKQCRVQTLSKRAVVMTNYTKKQRHTRLQWCIKSEGTASFALMSQNIVETCGLPSRLLPEQCW